MSTTVTTPSAKQCANCEFWAGQRKPHGTKTFVLYERDAKGECLKVDRPREGFATCFKWQKWAILK